MKADKEIVKEFIESFESDTFVRNEQGVMLYKLGHSGINLECFFEELVEFVREEYASLKVAEATLPNVKDWDEVYKKFKENYKNSEHILRPINFLSWLKQHYSTPLSASEHRTIKEVLDLFEAIRDCDEEDWLHNRYRMSVILKELQASVSEQSPDGYVQECMILNSKDELIKQTSSKVVPVYFSPQPKVSEVCSRCGYETGFINNLK